MKIQLIEPFQGGHYTNYIEALLPAFRRYLQNGVLSEVVISITTNHYDELIRKGIAKPEEVNIRFDSSFPVFYEIPKMNNRFAFFQAHQEAIKKESADVVVRTTADYDISCNAVLNQLGQSKINHKYHSVGILHYGSPRSEELSLKELVKQHLYDFSWKYSDWSTLMFVNPFIYEYLKSQKSFAQKRISLLPDPVPVNLPIDSVEARRLLGIPNDGLYLGFVGMMDGRKAIPELLAAFAHAKADTSCRLLLMGKMQPAFSKLLETEYAHLINSGRIIVMNRFLSAEEVHWGYAAIDVHTLLQYRRMNLSANLLKAVAYGKPVVVDSAGYTGIISQRFAFGQVCDVKSLQSTSDAIKRAIESVSSYVPTVQAERLKVFHHPDNYANSVMQELLPNHTFEVKTWEWVNQA